MVSIAKMREEEEKVDGSHRGLFEVLPVIWLKRLTKTTRNLSQEIKSLEERTCNMDYTDDMQWR
jgi:hypothetical protein